MFRIIAGDLDDPRVLDLLRVHGLAARAATDAGSAHVLDVSGLKRPDISFWTIWDGKHLAGMGAVKRLAVDEGELKSMHTAETVRGRGVARAMLGHLIATARAEGIKRLSLETGSWDYFRPARALYRSHGFVECAAFSDYREDSNSVFMSLVL